VLDSLATLNVEMIARLAQDQRPSTAVRPYRCMRERFKKNTCERCMDVCPENAISIDPSPDINSVCSDCGLCRIACPTEVFETYPDTDEYLLRQAKLVVSAVGRSALIVRCREARTPGEKSVEVACLGSISENFLVAAALLGVGSVALVKGVCRSCSKRPGERQLRESMEIAGRLARSLGLEGFVPTLEECPKTGESSVARREIFSAIGNRLRAGFGAATIDSGAGDREREIFEALCTSSDDAGTVGRRRDLLRRILLADAGTENVSTALPWHIPDIDEMRCSACGICASVCPTQALTETPADRRRVFAFHATECTSCGLCEEACPEGAIDLSDELTVAEFLDGKPRVVAIINLTSCAVCGDELPAIRGTTCPTCEKRQPTPEFLSPRHGI
jgi:ferredoxin